MYQRIHLDIFVKKTYSKLSLLYVSTNFTKEHDECLLWMSPTPYIEHRFIVGGGHRIFIELTCITSGWL